ncbi:hypothetical protein ACFW2V_12325 [Streptomyces sp. NPDC058947]|uniref:hypothetical protein n=1 Tax=Streptomyces sp. NPDC058947 TaxID=3346675 RepID=UPI0036C58D37
MGAEAKKYTQTEVTQLAALSRAYREALHDINRAITQELSTSTEPEQRTEIASKFGLPKEELPRYLPEGVLRVHRGSLHRANLRSTAEVLADVLLHIQIGHLKPGDQFPPRTAFTDRYVCDKATHKQVVDHLIRHGMIHRPGGQGGPLYVAPLRAEVGPRRHR